MSKRALAKTPDPKQKTKFKISYYIRVSTEEQAENPEGSIRFWFQESFIVASVERGFRESQPTGKAGRSRTTNIVGVRSSKRVWRPRRFTVITDGS